MAFTGTDGTPAPREGRASAIISVYTTTSGIGNHLAGLSVVG